MKKNKNIIIISFMSVVIISMFIIVYNTQIKELENTANTKATLVNEHIRLSRSFIEQMTTYGNEFLKRDDIRDSELFSLLKYNPEQNNYNLDDVVDLKSIYSGNLTGTGNVPESGINRDEINLAFEYNKYFGKFFDLLPDVAWLYYTSENDFINMYPWISSNDFSYSKELKTIEFYEHVNPENNPLRKLLWTPVYMDHAGKGLMVTLSSPIYYNETFKGVVSLDLTTDKLSEIISSKYSTHLIDDENSVLATNANILFDKNVLKLNQIVNISQSDINNIKQLKDGSVEKVGDYYVYSTGFDDAPWKMITLIHENIIVGKCLLFILPILIICILLLVSINEVENRKKTENLLKSSLKELKTYQDMLENAARYDFLTNTYNRRGFKEIFEKSYTFKSKNYNSISLIMCDIDYFKSINDTYGHAAGDKVLVEISEVMKKIINDDDVICRWGGEEYLIILIDKSCDEAVIVAENIRNAIENTIILWENSIELKTTMTLGVAKYCNDEGLDNNILKVDSALYDGKRNGRNQVAVYECSNEIS